jgi:protein O-GlcNAc transferase
LDPAVKYIEALRLNAKMFMCDWTDINAETSQCLARVRDKKAVAAPLNVLALSASAGDQLSCGELMSSTISPTPSRPLWSAEIYSHDRCRVAYLSADFRDHAVAYLIAGVFEQHDRRMFETFAFSYGAEDRSQTRERIKHSFEHFIDVRHNTPADIARLLRQHEIDIAVDLMCHTKDGRATILAMRPAPVQVNYLGFPGTTGAPWIDYLIADRYVVPESLQDRYSEKIVYLPDTFQANDSKRPRPQTAPPRAELGLPEDAFVFCCFNNTYKLTPSVFDVWMRLLQKVDNSVLWIFAPHPAAERNIRYEAAARGADPQRIVLAPPAPYPDHLARYRRADLFLDTLPFNAGTTASDALWCGLPVVTCSGEAFSSRMAGSLLHAAGLPELIATSLEGYEALALKLSREPGALATVKAKLASDNIPLFDTARFTRHIEAAFGSMWNRYRRGERPESFAVDAIDRAPS